MLLIYSHHTTRRQQNAYKAGDQIYTKAKEQFSFVLNRTTSDTI